MKADTNDKHEKINRTLIKCQSGLEWKIKFSKKFDHNNRVAGF
jgi:hypothetical protein